MFPKQRDASVGNVKILIRRSMSERECICHPDRCIHSIRQRPKSDIEMEGKEI